LQEERVNSEVVLVYSTYDSRIYAIEENTKIAVARRHNTILKYLPARVVVVGTQTPKRIGMSVNKLVLSVNSSTHYAPSSVGLQIAEVSL